MNPTLTTLSRRGFAALAALLMFSAPVRGQSGDTISGKAAENLTANTFVNTDGTTAIELLKISTADTAESTIGIVANTTTSGDPAAVITSGVARLKVDGSGDAIAAGDHLKPGSASNGYGILAEGVGDAWGAIALEPATTNGALIRVLVVQGTGIPDHGALEALSEAEVGVLDGVTPGTVTASKAVVVDSNKDAATFRNITLSGNLVSGSTTISETDIAKIDAITNGTAAASKALVLDSNKDIATIRHLTLNGNLVTGATTLDETDLAKVDSITNGTVAASKAMVVDSNKDIAGARNNTVTGAFTSSAGAATAAVAERFGLTATEGAEVLVIDEVVTLTNAVSTALTAGVVPAGGVILMVQGNLDTTVVGDGSGDDLLAKVGIGVSADPDKYGKTGALTKNQKIDTVPDWAVLGSNETILVYAVKTDGSACTEKFVGGESVRVRILYIAPNSLDDAP